MRWNISKQKIKGKDQIERSLSVGLAGVFSDLVQQWLTWGRFFSEIHSTRHCLLQEIYPSHTSVLTPDPGADLLSHHNLYKDICKDVYHEVLINFISVQQCFHFYKKYF